MKCEDASALLIDFLDGKLDSEDNKKVEEHIENCEKCLIEVKQTKEIIEKINSDTEVEPSSNLRMNFYKSLEKEKAKFNKSGEKLHLTSWYRAAGIAAIFLIGLFAGKLFFSHPSQNSESISEINKELKEMKQLVMFSMLDKDSPSERIKAISYSEELTKPDPKVTKALLETLNNDNNANVRLAATNALVRFADNDSIRNSLIKSLKEQEDPLIQIIIIKTLVQNNDKRAVNQFKTIINTDDTHELVIEEAKKGLDILL